MNHSPYVKTSKFISGNKCIIVINYLLLWQIFIKYQSYAKDIILGFEDITISKIGKMPILKELTLQLGGQHSKRINKNITESEKFYANNNYTRVIW